MATRISLFCDRVIEAGVLAAAIAVPLFFNVFSSRVFEPDKLTLLRSLVLFLVAVWLIKMVEEVRSQAHFAAGLRRFIQATPLNPVALALAGVYLLTTLTSISPYTSLWGSYQRLQGAFTYLSYITLFFLAWSTLRTRAQAERLVSVILATSVPICLYGIVQHFQLDPLPWGGDVTFRVTSTLGNAIFLAAYLIMVVPLTLSRLLGSVSGPKELRLWGLGPSFWRWALPSLYSALLVLQLLTLLFTKSRGPWLGLLAGLALFLLLYAWKTKRRWLLLGTAAAVVAVLAFIGLLNLPGSPLERLKGGSIYLERLGSLGDLESGTNRVRTLIWFGDGVGRGTWGLITDNPMRTLLGWGPEAMYVAYGRFYPPELAHWELRNATPDRSHNDILDLLATMGVLGLVAYFALLVVFFYQAGRLLGRSQNSAQSLLVLGLLAAVAAHLVETVTGIGIAATRTYLWLYAALLASLLLGERQIEAWQQGTAVAWQPALGLGRASTQVARGLGLNSPTSREAASVGRQAFGSRKARKKARRARERGLAPAAPPQRTAGTFPLAWLPFAAYALLTAAGVPAVLLGGASLIAEPSAMVTSGFFWLILGVLLGALALGRPALLILPPRPWGLAAYPLLGLAVLTALPLFFLNLVSADMYFKRGFSQAQTGNFVAAVPEYLDAVRYAPHEDYYFLFLGQAYIELARSAPAGESPRAVERVADLPQVDPNRSLDLRVGDFYKAALVALREARELNPLNTDNSANLGRLHRSWSELVTAPEAKKELLQKSLDYYLKAVALSPNTAHLRVELGGVYILLGQAEKARQEFETAVRLDPLYPLGYVSMGDYHRNKGDDDRAIEFYDKALALTERKGDWRPEQRAQVHSIKGEIFYRRGDLAKAAEENQLAIKEVPGDVVSYRNLAVIYRDMGRYDEALANARIALGLLPSQAVTQARSLQTMIEDLERKKG